MDFLSGAEPMPHIGKCVCVGGGGAYPRLSERVDGWRGRGIPGPLPKLGGGGVH